MKGVIKISNEQLKCDLIVKMDNEQALFCNELLSMKKSHILEYAYEYAVREDILFLVRLNEYSDKEIKALLKKAKPLKYLYSFFINSETDFMKRLAEIIKDGACNLYKKEAER